MVSAYVRGLQGKDEKKGVIATLKHFAGYSFSEGGRNFAPAHVGRREFMDVFLLPFEMAIKEGGALSVMNAYQDFDGEAPAGSRWLLTEILRERWGFKGFVVADYGAVTFLHMFHRVAAGGAEAAAMALSAGLDVELPNAVEFPGGLKDALEKGIIKEDDIDVSVKRVLERKFRLGLFESPYVDINTIELDLPGERALARTIAEKSITLLSNDGVLPLSKDTGKIAVIGPNADQMMALFGNYSFENHIVSTHYPDSAEEVVSAATVLDVIRERLSDKTVEFVQGCEITGSENTDLENAVEATKNAETAILVLGDKAGHFRQGTVGEGTDTADISLPGDQDRLARAVMETGTPTIIVLLNGRPFAMPEIAENASAIIEAWFPGQEGAGAIADVLFGDINPGGKTTLTFSRTAGAQPCFYNHKLLAKGVPNLPEFEPVFPFGHGLSYTVFEYSDLALSADEVPVDGEFQLGCTVRNTGDVEGEEVVQLYIQDLLASVTRPVKELKGFVRVGLEPGEAKKITFHIHTDMLSFTGIDFKRVVEPGEIKLMLGSSSVDIRLETTITLTGDIREVDEDRVLHSRVEVGR